MNPERSIEKFHAKLLTLVGKEITSEFVDFIINIYAHKTKALYNQRERINGQVKELAHLHDVIIGYKRPLVPIKDRKLDIVTIESSSTKVTVNPCSGRVSLKVSHKSSAGMRELFTDMVIRFVKDCPDFKPYTYRGKIVFDKVIGEYRLNMQTESKKDPFTVKFVYKPNN